MILSRYSFNPCFVGCWSGRVIDFIDPKLWKAFQSLFCWMLVWENERKNPEKVLLYVSILVLLDAGLGDRIAIIEGATGNCFNPCFVGCWSGSFFSQYEKYFIFAFQSLFCWMLVWELFENLFIFENV